MDSNVTHNRDIVRHGGKVYSTVKRLNYLYLPCLLILQIVAIIVKHYAKLHNLIYGVATHVYWISVICVIL